MFSVAASVLVAWNGWIYIYAVNSGHIVETSMGYFINPLTILPLIFFAAATPRVSLALLSICQYLAPSLQLFIGVVVYHELVDRSHWIAFGLIWLALIFFSAENLWWSQRRAKNPGFEVL